MGSAVVRFKWFGFDFKRRQRDALGSLRDRFRVVLPRLGDAPEDGLLDDGAVDHNH